MRWGSLCLAVLLVGCTDARPDDPLAPVAAAVSARTGLTPTLIADRDAPAIKARVAAVLAHPVSAAAAVSVALLRNPGLQADFARLGLVRAASIQAGLLQNPIFAGSVRFPDRLFGLTDIGLGLMQDVTGLILRPARQAIAATRYAEAEDEAADAAVRLIADTQSAYYQALAARQRQPLIQKQVDAARAGAALADAQYKAGNISALDQARAQADADGLTAALQAALLEETRTREVLNRLMGLSGPEVNWHLPAVLPDPPALTADPARWEQMAIADNFHLAALRHAVLAQAQALGVARRFGWLTDISAGLNTEQNPENYRVTGPELVAPLPLFDHGQATTLAATMRLARDGDRLIDAAIALRARTRFLRERLLRAQELVAFYQTVLIPERAHNLALAMRQYGYMLLGPFDLLRLKQDEISTEDGAIAATLDYWTARAELGRALGGENTLDANPAIAAVSHEATP